MQIQPQPILIPALRLRQKLATVIHQVMVDKKHFQVEKNGLPVMVILPVEEYQRLISKTEKDT